MLKSEELAVSKEVEEEGDDEEMEPWRGFPSPATCSAGVGHGSHSSTHGIHRIIKEDTDHLARQEEPWEHLSLLTGQRVAMVPVVMY